MPRTIPHVALLIETSRSYTREVLRGIRTYIADKGPWSVYMELRALDSPVPHWLHNWKGDGIITRSSSRRMIQTVKATGLPAVELRASRPNHVLPFVGVDNVALGRMVAEHLHDLGYRHFGVYRLHSEDFFQQRCKFLSPAFVSTAPTARYSLPRTTARRLANGRNISRSWCDGLSNNPSRWD